MITRYGKPVVISEVGMDVTDPTNSSRSYPNIIAKNSSLPGGNGLGVFYWEPEAYNWRGMGLVAFDTTGKPTHAMDAFGTGVALRLRRRRRFLQPQPRLYQTLPRLREQTHLCHDKTPRRPPAP